MTKEDPMRLDRIAVAVAMTTLCAASPQIGSARDAPTLTASSSCSPEVRACLDKLDFRLGALAGDPIRREEALLELYTTDPQCALLLFGADWARR
jgi:hypothetical protein